MTIKTYEDGWDCVPELTEAVDIYESVNHTIYEINKCQREQELCDIIE